MIDPKVKKLAKDFYKTVDDLNKIWAQLSSHGVYVNTKVDGTHSMDGIKSLKVDRMEQHIDYTKEAHNG